MILNRRTIALNGELTRMWKYFLHVAALASLSLAQPIFDLLSQFPQFLVAHHAGLMEVLLLVLLLTLVVPGSVVALESFQDRIMGARYRLPGSGIALFVFPLALLILKLPEGIPGTLLVGAAVLLAWLSRRAYLRIRPVRVYLTILSPAILIVPILFLTGPSVRRIITPAKPQGVALANGQTDTPIFMVVFDELPLRSLLDRRGDIDSVRFPNFADLAGRADWYRRTTSVSYSTQYALPAILTGNLPQADHSFLPTLAHYPDNLFTWLRNSHQLNISESITHLCPDCPESKPGHLRRAFRLLVDLPEIYLHLVLPEDLTTGLPDIRHGWTVPNQQRWRLGHPVRQFEAFLETLPEKGEPSLNFIHMQIPHLPWIYLPSGKRYVSGGDMSLFTKRDIWTRDETLVTLAFQRHLLQVGLADRLLGRLLRKLKADRLYDRSLIIVVSDHGVGFQPGGNRRKITEANFRDLLTVPLLIKAPYQILGRVSDRPTRTTDILPSIAEILRVPTPWPTDGISVNETAMTQERDPAAPSLITVPPSKFLRYRTTVCLEGMTFEVRQDGAWAHLGELTERGDKIILWGWAADMETLEPAESILVFVNDELIFQGMTRHPRPDVAKFFKAVELEDSGFYLELGRDLFQGSPAVRCFAVLGDRIREVQYPLSFPWPVEPKSSREETHSSNIDGTSCIDQKPARSFLITRSLSPETLWESSGSSEFETGLRELAWDAGPDGVFKMGPADSLLGKPLDQLPVTERRGLRIELDQPRLYERVRLDADFIPAAIEGWVSATDAEYVAIGLNGTLRAVAATFEGPDGRRRFQAIAPEASFVNGANRIQMFVVARENGKVLLLSPPENRRSR